MFYINYLKHYYLKGGNGTFSFVIYGMEYPVPEIDEFFRLY
jgi:hypothetical protein